MSNDVPVGRVVHGRYRLDEVLAAGGFGRVWRAYDQTLRAEVAIKEMLLPPAGSEAELAERRRRAEREARNAARLRGCPHTVVVYDVFIEDDLPWVVMQLVEGKSLADQLEAEPLPVDRAEQVARCVLEALRAAHAKGVVHRDIKPANILLADDGSVLLTDFGTAVHWDDTTVTQTGMLVASMEYIAPERLGDGNESAACDLFSLGATLYQAATGKSPFRRESLQAIVAAVLSHEPPRPELVGTQLGELITRLLNKDPALRPDAGQALAVLDAPGVGKTRVLAEPDKKQPDQKQPAEQKAPAKQEPTKKGGYAGLWIIGAIVAFIAFGGFYGQGAVNAKSGDCVWDSSAIPIDDGKWSRQPCSFPVPGATNYKVYGNFGYAEPVDCPAYLLRKTLGEGTETFTLCLQALGKGVEG
ncbi:serine/threonine-protein kinase [Flindersiella endophytica]